MLKNIKEYHRPRTIPEALKLLNRKNIVSRALAGGTYLTISKNPNIQALIDINNLGLSCIKKTGKGLSIGAATVIQDILESPVVKKFAGGIIHSSVERYASVLIRNVSTIGGNFLWPRPWSDVTPVLLALSARVKLQGLNKKETIPVEKILVSKPRNVIKDRLITEIFIPAPAKNSKGNFIKFTQTEFDVAFTNVAVWIELNSKKIVKDARLVLGAVRGQPFRLTTAEAVLKGQAFNNTSIEQATKCAARVKTYDEPRASAAYKQKMIPVILKRALRECLK